MPVQLYLRATIGSAGAVTLDVPNSKGVKSIVLGTAGKYTVTLQDPYVKLLFADALIQNATGIAAAPAYGVVTSGTNVNTSTGGTIVIQFANTAGAATNPASGDILFMNLVLGNSTAP